MEFEDSFNSPEAECANCGTEALWEDMLFDERAETFFCDNKCFRDWADDNYDEVVTYYAMMNVYE